VGEEEPLATDGVEGGGRREDGQGDGGSEGGVEDGEGPHGKGGRERTAVGERLATRAGSGSEQLLSRQGFERSDKWKFTTVRSFTFLSAPFIS